jgi:hypothetical protein
MQWWFAVKCISVGFTAFSIILLGWAKNLINFREIIRLGGLETEDEYPYDAEKEPTCKLEKSEVAAYINSSIQLPKDEVKMQAYLFKNGPISIGKVYFLHIKL